MSDALVIYQQFDQIQRAATALHSSGYFSDTKSQAQAIVKVMAGAELGLPPFASMTGIHIIQGKPALGANVIATLVKNDPRYDYRVKSADNSQCVLVWFEGGRQVGESSFTFTEAQTAGLTSKDNWKKFPSDMLFARAITRGARRFAPGIFGGAPVYTPDELGADIDENGDIVDAPAYTVQPPAQAQRQAAAAPVDIEDGPEWVEYTEAAIEAAVRYPEEVRAALAAAQQGNGNAPLAQEKQLKFARSSLGKIFKPAEAKLFLKYVFGIGSSTELTVPGASAIIDWIGATKDNGYNPTMAAQTEALAVYNEAVQESVVPPAGPDEGDGDNMPMSG